MTDRELMQQALEALELVTDLTNHDDEVYAAIDALRERLARPEQHQDWCASLTQMLMSMPPKPAPCNCKPKQPEQTTGNVLMDAFHAMQAKKQSVQEPVAMRYDFDGYGYRYIDSGSGSNWQTRIKDAEPLYAAPVVTVQEPVAWLSDDGNVLFGPGPKGKYKRPLYTAPPRREWVGLTLAEFDEIHARSETMHEAMVDVVKKLREKNA